MKKVKFDYFKRVTAFIRERERERELVLIIVFLSSDKTPIDFWYSWRSNPKSLIRQQNTLLIKLTRNHRQMGVSRICLWSIE